ncbi:hypothetical protein DERP_007117 [Dermatophagoides pteronyssinus]|uniref:Uncharacterized protein n=2 Tax=Dermatophagoides pteronyssinus TaxID=6956 RepID=A0ABQ8JVA4_DERPT|nr:hypothetical protein DERP_007117 [Dermatophagoides pteronyssinus]
MAQLILGLGIGLFTLLLLWAIAIIFCLISSRLRVPASYIGPISCMIALFITIILLSLPISKRLDQSLSSINNNNNNNIRMENNNNNQSIQMTSIDENEFMIVDWNTYILLPLCLIISMILLTITSIMSIQFHLSINHHQNRIQIFWNIYQQWSRCLPTGGVERMLCIMMATFLVLMIFSIQLCLRIDGYLDWIWSSNSLHFPWKYFWWWNSNHRKNHRICEPPNYDEKISFDCYVLLLIIGWLSSMFLAIFTMAIHFVYWWWRWYYFRRRQ